MPNGLPGVWYHESKAVTEFINFLSGQLIDGHLGIVAYVIHFLLDGHMFFEVATCEASLVNLVADFSSVVHGWSPAMH
jgi:hypothetical protein